MKKVQSSHVDSYHYEPESKRLSVKFRNGQIYTYDGIHQHDMDALDKAPSVGKHMIEHIFNKKQGRKT